MLAVIKTGGKQYVVSPGDKIKVEKINVDEKPQEASKYGVMGIPTVVVLKDGSEVGRKTGVTSKTDLIALINS